MFKLVGTYIYKNCANLLSLLGVAPLFILFQEGGFQYIIPLIIYNNIMDDLDGAVAKKLKIRTQYGSNLDNICDAVAHSIIVISVGIHFGGNLTLFSVVAVSSIILRIANRFELGSNFEGGTQTNELMRHIMFILLISELGEFNPSQILASVFVLNSISMLITIPFPFMLVHFANNPTSLTLFNLSLILAFLVKPLSYIFGGAFFLTYIYSFTKVILEQVMIQITKLTGDQRM